MRNGSKMIIYSITKKAEFNGTPYYLGSFIEKVYNSNRGTANKWEYSIQKALFSTDLDIEPAIFNLHEDSKDKYSVKNISNPEKSVVRVLDFSVETVTQWQNGEPVLDENKRPLTRLKYTINKVCYEKDYKSETSQMSNLKKKIEQLEKSREQDKETIADLRQKLGAKSHQISYRNKLVEKEKEKTARVQKRLNTVIETQRQTNNTSSDDDDITFEEI